jgi:hypothetical protein
VSDNSTWNGEQLEASVRELFDTSNRVRFAELIKERALDPEIAMRRSDKVREVYFAEPEKTWNSFKEECGFRSHAEIKEALDEFRIKEAQLGDQQPRTLMDLFQAGGLFLTVDAPRADHARPLGQHREDISQDQQRAHGTDLWFGSAFDRLTVSGRGSCSERVE